MKAAHRFKININWQPLSVAQFFKKWLSPGFNLVRRDNLLRRLSIMLALSLLLPNCKKNPASDNDITASSQMSGQVVLSDGEKPSEIYVWLDGTSFATYTDQNGAFQINLPPVAPNVLVGASVHTLYFYLANYQLSSVDLAVRDGKFLYSRGGLNSRGELNNTVSLLKRLHIETTVEPAEIASDYQGPVNVQLSLHAAGDSVTVLFPQSESAQLPALFFRHKETGAVFSHALAINPIARDSVKVGPEAYRRRLTLAFTPDYLPQGSYEVVPYFLIVPEQALPPGLLPNLGEAVETFTANFLKIPTRRAGGQLVVKSRGESNANARSF